MIEPTQKGLTTLRAELYDAEVDYNEATAKLAAHLRSNPALSGELSSAVFDRAVAARGRLIEAQRQLEAFLQATDPDNERT